MKPVFAILILALALSAGCYLLNPADQVPDAAAEDASPADTAEPDAGPGPQPGSLIPSGRFRLHWQCAEEPCADPPPPPFQADELLINESLNMATFLDADLCPSVSDCLLESCTCLWRVEPQDDGSTCIQVLRSVAQKPELAIIEPFLLCYLRPAPPQPPQLSTQIVVRRFASGRNEVWRMTGFEFPPGN